MTSAVKNEGQVLRLSRVFDSIEEFSMPGRGPTLLCLRWQVNLEFNCGGRISYDFMMSMPDDKTNGTIGSSINNAGANGKRASDVVFSLDPLIDFQVTQGTDLFLAELRAREFGDIVWAEIDPVLRETMQVCAKAYVADPAEAKTHLVETMEKLQRLENWQASV